MARPFDAGDRDGRLYGRGAQDMKGGVAAMIGAARAHRRERRPRRGPRHRGRVVDEEHASIGADALVATWRADAAVVTEPTDLDIAVAHKGFEWVEIETRGRAAHGSRPREGRDAILRMGRVLARLEALDRRLQRGPSHPLLGTASLHASLIDGGRELSSYPDRVHAADRAAHASRRAGRRRARGSGRDPRRTSRAEDPEFEAEARLMFGRDAYEIDARQSAAGAADAAPRRAAGCRARRSSA